MKKATYVILAVILVMSMSFSAFAADIKVTGNTTGEVTATYLPEATATVYSVDISWGSMEFTYSAGSKGEWDPSTHAYKEGTAVPAGWSCDEDANLITITNHSNTSINAVAVFEPSQAFKENFASSSNVSAGISGNSTESEGASMTIASAADHNEAVSEYFVVNVAGDVSEAFDKLVLGTVTVTIS